jgi:hypothetical protein
MGGQIGLRSDLELVREKPCPSQDLNRDCPILSYIEPEDIKGFT